ncbi:MAG: hypothetical protein ABFD18_15930 [Syntrophomonas sp.]
MLDGERFTAGRKIFAGHSIEYYRAVRETDGVPVILKRLKTNLTDEEKLYVLNSEIESANKLNHDGILKLLDVPRYRHELVLVYGGFRRGSSAEHSEQSENLN